MHVAAGEQTASVEYPLILNGNEHWFSARISMRCDAAGEYDGVTIVVRDDTERKQAEEAVRQSESQLRGIVTSLSKSAIVLIDRDGNYLAAWSDSEFDRRVGRSSKELPGRNMADALPPDKLKEFLRAVRHVSDNRSPLQFEYPLTGAEGRALWHEVTLSPMMREGAEVKAVVVMIHDITERKKAEAALLVRESFENLIMSISTEFVNMNSDEIDAGIERALKSIGEFSDTDRSYVFLFDEAYEECCNTHEWCRAGVTPEKEHLQNCRTADMTWWMKQLREARIVYLKNIEEMLPEATVEYEVLKAQGIVSLLVVPMYYAGRLIGFLGFDSVRGPKGWDEEIVRLLRVVSDLLANACMRKNYERDLRESEELYRLIAENQSDVIWTLDRNLKYTYISPSIRTLRGYEPNDVMKTRSILDAVDPESLQRLLGIIEEEKHLEKEKYNPRRTLKLETRVKHRDGRNIWVEVHINYLRDADNRFSGVLGVTRDISDRKDAEMKLRQSEELYRTVVENSGESITILDRDGKCLFLNGTAAERRGGRVEDYIGKTLFEVYPAEIAERKLADVRRVIDSGEGDAVEYQIPVGGEWRWFRILLQPLRDSEGRIFTVMVLSFDIEKNKSLLRELTNSRETVNAVFTNIQEFFIILNEGGVVLHANPYIHVRLGYSENEMNGFDIGRFIAADFIKGKEQLFSGVPEVGSKSMFIPFIARDGSWIYTESRISKGHWEGREVFFGVCRDLTERVRAEKDLKESEATARTLLNLMPSIAMLVDPEGPILAVNTKATESLGLSEEELLGKSPFDLFDREVAENRVIHFVDAVRERRPIEFEDDRDGMHFKHIVVPLFDDNGEIMRFAVFSTVLEDKDIS